MVFGACMEIRNLNLSGYAVKAIRLLKRWSHQDLSDQCDIDRNYIAMMESDIRRVSQPARRKFEEAFGETIHLSDEELDLLLMVDELVPPKLLLIAAEVVKGRLKLEDKENDK